MALKWIEGFEAPDTGSTFFGRKYANGSGPSTHAGRVAGNAAVLGAASKWRTNSLGTDNIWTMGCGWKGNDVTAATDWNFRLYQSATEQFRMRVKIDTAGELAYIVLMRGATVLYTSSKFIDSSGWHYIELQVNVNTGTSGAYELRVDLVTITSNGAANTANAGSAGADVAEWASVVSSAGYLDDIYLVDSTVGDGLGNTTFRGDSQVVGFKPNGNGALRQWSRSTGANDYTLVADTNDATYLFDSTVGHEVVMDFEDPSIPTGTIFGIQLTSLAALDVAGTRQYVTEYYDGTSHPFPTAHVVASTTIAGYSDVVEANPATGTNWASSELNSGQFGLKVTV